MDYNKKRTRRDMQPWTDLSDLKDIHKNEKCFILGAGPSIGFLNLTDLNKHVVISVNSSIMLLDWREGPKHNRYWISNDRLCVHWDYFWKYVIRSKCNKIVRTSWKKYDAEIREHDFRYFTPRKSEAIPLSDNDGGLCFVSSVPTAVDLSILMGCDRIYLVGVDHRMLHGNSHFWQFWNRKKWPRRKNKASNFRPEQKHQLEVFDKNLKVFQSLQEYAARKECVIKNCSNISMIELFEKITFAQALGE